MSAAKTGGEPGGPSVAVAIPCFNEEAAIGAVVDEWRRELPGAEVVVFDNASTDGSAAIAAGSGARVVPVADRGKGFVVRRAFDELGDRDAVILVDGDGTYPAGAVGPLLEAVLDGRAEMAVGARRPVSGSGAMSPVRGLGNRLIRLAFRALIGPGTGDLLSGYRVVSRRFMGAVRLRSEGFEIETELAGQAEGRRLPVAELPVPYRPRIGGTTSKLCPARDGLRILGTIVRIAFRLRPWRPLMAATLAATLVAAALRSDRAWWVVLGLLLVTIWAAAMTGVRRELVGVPSDDR